MNHAATAGTILITLASIASAQTKPDPGPLTAAQATAVEQHIDVDAPLAGTAPSGCLAIPRHVIAGGGGTSISGSGVFVVTGTIAQYDADLLMSEDRILVLRGGFWPGADEAPESCPADVNNDNEVDVDDLVAVITAWGLCPDRPDPCPADSDCNGEVDVDDLVQVIVDWGSCG